MTNGEKYKTTEERVAAYKKFCDAHKCESCPLDSDNGCYSCCFQWLELESAHAMLPCPFCGGTMILDNTVSNDMYAFCECGYCTPELKTDADVTNAHNRVAGLAKASGEEVSR